MKKPAVGHIIKHEYKPLSVIDKIAQNGLIHQINIFIGVGAHILKCDFLAFLPVVVAKEERTHLVFVIAYRVTDSIP